jgi:hypothetical protein
MNDVSLALSNFFFFASFHFTDDHLDVTTPLTRKHDVLYIPVVTYVIHDKVCWTAMSTRKGPRRVVRAKRL